MTCQLSEISMTGDIPVIINMDRITSIREETIDSSQYIIVQLAEDQVVTSYESPYICGQAILSGEFPKA